MEKRPNILFIMTDQFRGDVMSGVGGPARTPNLDALAAEGVCFTNCSTVSPLCVPARISMMTGKYPHTTGSWDNAAYALSPDANLWSKEIKKMGYSTAVFGKLHLHTDFGDMIAREPIVHGYGFDVVNEISGPHSTCQTRTHMGEEWKEKGLWDAYCEDMESRGKIPRAKPSPLPLEDYYDSYVGRKAKEYLESYDGEQPWFLHVSFGGPHEPWDTPEPYASMYDPADMPDPLPRIQDEAADRPQGVLDDRFSRKPIQTSVQAAKEIRANYCGGVTLIDQKIGEIIEVIKKRGEWENTVILFTSDHGEMNGDHGIVNKRAFLRGALNVPFILRVPGSADSGEKREEMIGLMDVGPTLVEAVGGELPYVQFGRNVLSGEQRNYILGELMGEVMYMEKDVKIVLNQHGQPYLIVDLEEDPNEQHNLAGTPRGDQIWTEKCKQLLSAMAENSCYKPSLMQMPTPDPWDRRFKRSVNPAG